jgi:hypothetical protein
MPTCAALPVSAAFPGTMSISITRTSRYGALAPLVSRHFLFPTGFQHRRAWVGNLPLLPPY